MYRRLTNQPEVQRPGLGERRLLPPLDDDINQQDLPVSALTDDPHEELPTLEDDYSEAEQVIRQHCEQQWPNDYQMRSYCTKQQREALAILKQGRPQEIPEEVFAGIRNKCTADWPNDYAMRQYCEKQQFDSYRELESG